MGFDVATTPDQVFNGQVPGQLKYEAKYTQGQYEDDKEDVQQKRSGFLGAILNFTDKADDVANSVTGGMWDKVQDNILAPVGKAVWYPVDKLATGAHWLYSNVVSRPLSMILQMDAQAALDADPSIMFSGKAWSDAWDQAENISPGQVVTNAALTGIARGDIGPVAPFMSDDVEKLQNIIKESQVGKDARERNTARLIQDTDYWRDKAGWTYTAGSGTLDFMSVMFLDPSTYLTAGVSSAVKGVRSIKYIEQGGELVRDQGKVVRGAKALVGKKPQTVEEVASGKKMNEFFDWVTSEGANGAARKTEAEIASHPIFGRGRRAAVAKNQLASLMSRASRDDLPLIYRYSVGDQRAAAELMAKGSNSLDDIGRVMDNRKLVGSVNFEPALLAYFAEKEGAKVAAGAELKPPLVLSPEATGLHEQAAKAVLEASPKMKINAAGTVSKSFIKQANTWKASQVDMVNQELARAEGIGTMLRSALAENLGAEDFSTAVKGAHLFGSLPQAYRMGNGAFRSTTKAAEKKFANKMADRRGVFSTEGLRRGFLGTPVRMLQAFGDRTPVGRINHNDADAGDRVYEMLREVPALGADQRSSLLNKYLTAGDKTAKSRALDEIHGEVMNHMAQRVHGLDPEIANIFQGMTKVGIADTVNKLAGKTVGSSKFGTKQAFSSAMDEGAAKTVDHIEDGVGWSVSPLAKTQLSQTDSLLPIKEINRVLARNSGGMKTLRRMGGSAADVTRMFADNANTIWKASTLLRPAYTARMVSEELAAAAIKFGFLSHIMASGTKGSTNFVLNRGQWLNAELGNVSGRVAEKLGAEKVAAKIGGSYTPSTGAGVDSRLAVVNLGDDEVIASAKARRAALEKEIAAAQAKPKNPARIAEIQTAIKGTKKRKEIDALRAELKTIHSQPEVDSLKAQLAAVKTTRIRVNKALPVIDARIKMEREAQGKLQQELARFEKKRKSILDNNAGKPMSNRSAIALEQHQQKIEDLASRIDDHGQVINEFAQYSNYVLNRAVESTGRRIGEKSYQYRGMTVPQAFSKEWTNPISRSQFDAEGDVAASAIYARAEAVDKERLIRSGSWDYITPDQPQHMAEWLNALNRQFAQDEGFRLVMQDSTGEAARRYFATPAGKQHLKDIGGQGKDPEELIKKIRLTLDKYLPEDTGLRQKLLDGEDLTKADLHKAIPPNDFPVVHGQEVLDKTALWGKHQPGNILDAAIKNGFKRLGAIPSSVMSRNPVYVKFQEGRMKELIDGELRVRMSQGKTDHLTPEELNQLMLKSDKMARKDMAQIVYDPTRTSASEALRFIAPFYSAHADGLARWGGLIAEKPQALGRIAQIYNAPVAANMVTDAQGNLVGQDGYADIVDPTTYKLDKKGHPIPGTAKVIGRKFVPIQDRTLHLKAPWAEKGSGTVPIKLQAMNTILPGDPWWNPGSGPMVQVAGTALAKAAPSTGEFLQWSKILPYGPSGSMTEAITPKYMRSLWAAYQGDDPDNEAYQKAYLAIWNKKQMEFHENGTKFSPKEIEQEAKQFLFLDFLEAWGSPAQTQQTPLTGTPYQFFVDQLSQLKKIDPETANDRFLAKFGADYSGFTASLSKSMGIAATISADQQAEKYKDEISADPDMAAFWVGDVYNGGPFSSAVYAKQMEQNFGAEKAREKIPAEHAIEQNQISTGWNQYKAGKMYLDYLLIRNGFKSYSESGAEQLNQARKNLVDGTSQQYPAWGEAFNVTDRGKVQSRIRSFEIALKDEKLMNDPMRREMPVLQQYLAGRAMFKKALKQRGASQVSYAADGITPIGESADIGYAWGQFRMGLANSNIAFNELMNRYLSNDDLQ